MAWFADWFNTPYYHLLYQNRDYTEAENFIKVLTDYLRLPKMAYFVDLACGRGRHSVYLNHLGYKVLGLDLSEKSILHAQKCTKEHLNFAVHDMRSPMPVRGVDAVVNLFTSFGYFDEAAEDEQVFTSVSQALNPGGFFVLDFLNERFVQKNLVPKEEIVRGDITFGISREVDGGKVVKDICFQDNGNFHHFQEVVKLHSLEEIEELGISQGLAVKEVFGDYHLGGFDVETSPRCIIIFQKCE